VEGNGKLIEVGSNLCDSGMRKDFSIKSQKAKKVILNQNVCSPVIDQES
jgi:hypothetical protein